MSNEQQAAAVVETQISTINEEDRALLTKAAEVGDTKTTKVLEELRGMGNILDHQNDVAEATAVAVTKIGRGMTAVLETTMAIQEQQRLDAVNAYQESLTRQSLFKECTGFTESDLSKPEFRFSWGKTLKKIGSALLVGGAVGGTVYATSKAAERGGRKAGEDAVNNLLAASSAPDDTDVDDD